MRKLFISLMLAGLLALLTLATAVPAFAQNHAGRGDAACNIAADNGESNSHKAIGGVDGCPAP